MLSAIGAAVSRIQKAHDSNLSRPGSRNGRFGNFCTRKYNVRVELLQGCLLFRVGEW